DQRAAVGLHRDQPARPSAVRVLEPDLDEHAALEQFPDQVGDGGQAQPGGRGELLPGDRRLRDHVAQQLIAIGPADIPRRALHQLTAPLWTWPVQYESRAVRMLRA